MTVVVRASSLLLPCRMRIVKADKPCAIWRMQSQRIIKAMRLVRGYGNAGHDETNPVTAFRIDNEHLPIEVEKRVEREIVWLRHATVITLR
jgi:hypothetical protein